MLPNRPPLSDLDRLEHEGNDDFHLLSELGPEHFGIDHLYELRAEARERITIFERRRRLSMIIGAVATGWTVTGLLGGLLQVRWLSLAGYLLSGISFSVFLGVIIWQKIRFESRGELEYALQVIEEELQKRASKKTA